MKESGASWQLFWSFCIPCWLNFCSFLGLRGASCPSREPSPDIFWLSGCPRQFGTVPSTISGANLLPKFLKMVPKIASKTVAILSIFLKPFSKRKQHQKCFKIDSKMELKMLTDRLRNESRESVTFNNTPSLQLDF